MSCNGQIFKENPLIKEGYFFFIIRFYLAAIFLSLIKAEVRVLVKLVKRSKTSLQVNFFHEDTSQYNSFESSNDISQSMME